MIPHRCRASHDRCLLWHVFGAQEGCGLPRGFVGEAMGRKIRTEPYFCRAGIRIGSVLCDGSIGTCPNIDRSLVQGNTHETGDLDAWATRCTDGMRGDGSGCFLEAAQSD